GSDGRGEAALPRAREHARLAPAPEDARAIDDLPRAGSLLDPRHGEILPCEQCQRRLGRRADAAVHGLRGAPRLEPATLAHHDGVATGVALARDVEPP